MKASRQWLIGVAAVFLSAAVSSAYPDDYVATDLDDPLQPVWNTLDRLPTDMSETVIRSIRTQFTTLSRQLDNKLRPLTSAVNAMNSVTATLRSLEQRQSGGVAPSSSNSNLIQFYQNRITVDMAEAVSKLERHIDTKMAALETKLTEHINTKFSSAITGGGGGGGGRELPTQAPGSGGEDIAVTVQENKALLENVNTHILKINEKLGGSEEGDNSCVTLVDKVSELMGGSAGGGEVCANRPPEIMRTGLPRDCSDTHWQQNWNSGVYEIFPTLDPKAPVSAYCDMGDPAAKNTGGWTVILRRRNTTFGLVSFNRTWDEYRMGFGDPAEGEWWFGLGALHALTYRQPFEVDLLLHDIQKGTYHAQYSTFRVEDEAHNFRLLLSGFTGNLTHDALTAKHHGSPFTTPDRDNDAWPEGNCGQSNAGGWWFDACHFTTLTAPFPTSTDRDAKTIRWLEDEWLVLDDVIMKIRPESYADRFKAHSAA